ncbi:histidine kinase [Flavobacteriaceae bacterium F89]|uniref:Histidine kinase n=1 Tax=Cerina litoralis TaxID=2874477 RepID=A0AAE3EXL4_9FLAO|nr:histidine kinase [Cerina litoralis]MCG2462773.1 histidine kinase [Cerina litoralis]
MRRVRTSEILKIAAVFAILASLPSSISLFKTAPFSFEVFAGTDFKELILNLLVFFFFAWLVMQFNSNWGHAFRERSMTFKIGLYVLVNLGILIGTVSLYKLVAPSLIGNEISERKNDFLNFIFTIHFIILFFISRILRLQLYQRENQLENERLKHESLHNELAALKNQINPHFLFNSLNSLNFLVRENKEATLFIRKLSFMYRYILQSGDSDMVTVEEELKFLGSYSYLIKTRYRGRFMLNINLEDSNLQKELPPLALQLLVENAVKHNEISEEFPLEVKIYDEQGYICVENKIRPRTSLEEGTGNGLSNLDKRFFLLSNQHIQIDRNNAVFCVKIPLGSFMEQKD